MLFRHSVLRGARATGPPPVNKSLTVAGAALASTARAPRHRVSRSMTNSATSRVMANVHIVSDIAPPFSGGTTPETPEEEVHPQYLIGHAPTLRIVWDETRSRQPFAPWQMASGPCKLGDIGARDFFEHRDFHHAKSCNRRAVGLLHL
jgi:hypothetical protein